MSRKRVQPKHDTIKQKKHIKIQKNDATQTALCSTSTHAGNAHSPREARLWFMCLKRYVDINRKEPPRGQDPIMLPQERSLRCMRMPSYPSNQTHSRPNATITIGQHVRLSKNHPPRPMHSTASSSTTQRANSPSQRGRSWCRSWAGWGRTWT